MEVATPRGRKPIEPGVLQLRVRPVARGNERGAIAADADAAASPAATVGRRRRWSPPTPPPLAADTAWPWPCRGVVMAWTAVAAAHPSLAGGWYVRYCWPKAASPWWWRPPVGGLRAWLQRSSAMVRSDLAVAMAPSGRRKSSKHGAVPLSGRRAAASSVRDANAVEGPSADGAAADAAAAAAR